MFRIFVPVAFVIMVWAQQAPAPRSPFSPAPGSPVVVGEGSGRLILADVNGDRRLDLVTSHLMKKIIAVQLGDGAGRFAAAPGSALNLKFQPGDIKLADLNGDDIPDLAITHSELDEVDLYFGDGQGGFKPAPGSPFAASGDREFYTRSLDLIDLNGDGRLDIVTANRHQGAFGTLLGDGRGRFAPGPGIVLAPVAEAISIIPGDIFGDLDGDNHPDLVLVSGARETGADPSRLRIFHGNGKGAFRERSPASSPIPAAARFVRLADMNGDRRPDIVTSHQSDRLNVLLNAGNDKFVPAPGSPYDIGAKPFAISVEDINRDQRNDLVAAAADGIVVLLGGRDGLAPATGSPFRAGPGAHHLAVGDVNKDGKLDIAASSFEGNAVTLLLGR